MAINTKFVTSAGIYSTVICGTSEGEGIMAKSSRAQNVRKGKVSYYVG